jgi:hypothetical protein
MKKLPALFILVLLAVALSFPARTAESTSTQRYEYAVVKWDGPDRIYYNLPDRFELVYLTKTGVTIPKDAQPEEFCLAYAANKLAKENWEVVNLDSRRLVLRRAK